MESSIDFARLLLDKARDDAYVVVRLCDDPAAPDWVIGFHAEQAVEKAMKAMLASREIEYPRTHNIAMLIELLRQNTLPVPPEADELPRLVPFGVALRYDDAAGEENFPLDRTWARRMVSATIAWVERQLDKGMT
ncbi:HEPN domain-containing protein [Sulfuricystis thermophila]|uniref:HEPN domain-containing protein n=1 Tax=Sulfuricystis thermophila TaxID=2496847 RepID=UPI001559D6D2|nr:HEPN domain-containing protein [Sulfuricystis thermophila]